MNQEILTRGSRSRIQAPLGLQWFFDFLRLREFQVTDFSGNDGTFVSGFQFGHQFGLEFASFLRVQVTNFFRYINERGDGFFVALFGAFFSHTASSTDFDGQFFATGVSDEFALQLKRCQLIYFCILQVCKIKMKDSVSNVLFCFVAISTN